MSSSKNFITQRVRELRRLQTPAENELWQALRNRNWLGYKFRRQHPIRYAGAKNSWAFYVADFYCAERKLVVELDGAVHRTQELQDAVRDANLEAIGIQVLRFRNAELRDMNRVLETIGMALRGY